MGEVGQEINAFHIEALNARKVENQYIGTANIYTDGEDNLYPDRIRAIIENSTTAMSAVRQLQAFLIGDGFFKENEDIEIKPVVNIPKGKTLKGFLIDLCKSLSYHRGAYIHVNYDINNKIKYLDVLPYHKCRISTETDFGSNGYIYYKQNGWNYNSIFSSKDKGDVLFYPYTDNKDIIQAQQERAIKENIEYMGQVLFLNLDTDRQYPLSYIHSAYNDADSQYQISLYKNSILRNGFLGKVIVFYTKPQDKTKERQIISSVKEMMGTKDGGGVLCVEMEKNIHGEDDLPIKIKQIEPNLDDAIFKHSEESIKSNILNAFGIPKIVVDAAGDSSLFSSSGTAIENCFYMINHNTRHVRSTIEDIVNKLLSNFVTPYQDLYIKELSLGNKLSKGNE